MIYIVAFVIALLFPGTVLAAAPTVSSSTTSQQEGSNVTSHTFNLPAACSSGCPSGRILVVLSCVDGSSSGGVTVSNVVTNGQAITELATAQSSSNTGSPIRLYMGWRRTTGAEGETGTFTTSNAQMSSHVTYLVDGVHASSSPEAGTATLGSTLETTPDPPSLSPSWGEEETLWIASMCADNAAILPAPTFPTDYSSNQLSTGTGSASGKSAMATRALTTATEDPGEYTIATSAQAVAATVAIRPSAAGAGGAPTIIHQFRLRR